MKISIKNQIDMRNDEIFSKLMERKFYHESVMKDTRVPLDIRIAHMKLMDEMDAVIELLDVKPF